MGQPHAFRFGTQIQAASRAEFLEQVRKVEELGYSAIAVVDHVSGSRLAPISTLAAVAALDSSLRLTSTVFGNDFRHPALLASEAATIDVISNGRVELGIGTGWQDSDYAQSGIAFDPIGIRISRLIEAVQIMKGLFSDHSVTFAGEYYNVHGLNLMPKPVQRPRPPLLIGGGGKRMLSLAARDADIVSVNMTTKDGAIDFASFAPQVFAQKVAWVRDVAGARLADLELHTILFRVIVTNDQRHAAEQWIKQMEASRGTSLGMGIEDVLASPYMLIGTLDQMVAKLQACREQYGVSYFTTAASMNMETLSPVVAQLAGT